MEVIPHADFPDPLLQQRGRRRLQYARALGSKPTTVVAAVAALALALWQPLAILVAWLVIAIVVVVLAFRRAKAEWWLALLDHLGMTPTTDDDAPPLTPLLRSGDEREVLRSGEDARRALLVFRSTDVSHDSKGNRQESHHDYTVVLIRHSDARLRFLSAHEHRFAAMKFLGDDLRGRAGRSVDEFTVESVELGERFVLRCSEEDGAAARSVFRPSVIVWFARHGVPFEYEEGTLAVFVDRVLEHAEEIKVLLARADQIDAAIRGEFDATP